MIDRYVDWPNEVTAIQQSPLHANLPRSAYLEQAMRHKFCLVAPGDTRTTRKLAEAFALAAAGGCLPVIVLPSVLPSVAHGMLPYLDWLDYCSVSFVVLMGTGGLKHLKNTPLIDKLLAVDERRAESMRAAACRLQAAFTFRNDSSAEQPSAAEYILDAACQAAKRMKQARPFTTAERQRVPDFSRCTL